MDQLVRCAAPLSSTRSATRSSCRPATRRRHLVVPLPPRTRSPSATAEELALMYLSALQSEAQIAEVRPHFARALVGAALTDSSSSPSCPSSPLAHLAHLTSRTQFKEAFSLFDKGASRWSTFHPLVIVSFADLAPLSLSLLRNPNLASRPRLSPHAPTRHPHSCRLARRRPPLSPFACSAHPSVSLDPHRTAPARPSLAPPPPPPPPPPPHDAQTVMAPSRRASSAPSCARSGRTRPRPSCRT